MDPHFEWDPAKDEENQCKHGVEFSRAQFAFMDPRLVLAVDLAHSSEETRYYCFGKVEGKVMTVRFTFRENKIRIFGAAYWRQGRRAYEEENQVHGS